MITSIALLRGINVGGNRKIAMADLRAIFDDAGYADVSTYIQSGNVIFRHPKDPQTKLADEIEHRLAEATGMDVPVILRTAAELAAVVRATPFDVSDPTQLHVAFFAKSPHTDAFAAVDVERFAPEEMVVAGREVYLYLPNGMGRAKLPAALGKRLVSATARNWRTVTTLAELAAR